MIDAREIKLLVLEDDGQTVWRTFQGKPLVGTDTICLPSWNGRKLAGFWAVFEAKNGRLVVFHSETLTNETGKLTIVDSFEKLKDAVPEDILLKAELAAGIRKLPEYLVLPLDVR